MAVSFAVYLVAMLAVGYVASRRATNDDEFLLAGRQLGPWAASLSAAATSMSGWLFLGFPGQVFLYGLSAAWIGIGCILGDWLNWRLTARGLQERTSRMNAYTLTEFVTGCGTDPLSRFTRCLAGFGIVAFMTVYLAAQFVASGKALGGELGLGIEYQQAVWLCAVVVIAYTLLGGFVAVVWTDVAQAVIMVLALVLLPLWLFGQVVADGRLPGLLAAPAHATWGGAPVAAAGVTMGDWFGGLTGMTFVAFLAGQFGTGAGYLGQPQIASRFMAMKHADETTVGRRISVTWTTLTVVGATLAALSAHALLPTDHELFARGKPADSERVLLHMMHSHLPTWLSGIVISGLMAAVMSSASAFLITAVSSIQKDFPEPLQRAARGTWASRLLVLAVGGTALALAVAVSPDDPRSSVFKLSHLAWSGLALTFAVPMLYRLWVPGASTGVVLPTMLAGVGAMAVWHRLGLADHTYEVLPCMAMQAVACAILHAGWRVLSAAPAAAARRGSA